jgi:hypothetical protein
MAKQNLGPMLHMITVLANWEKVVFLLKTQYYYPVFAKLEAF